MVNITVDDWKQVPTAVIEGLIKQGNNELNRRRDEERDKAIKAFLDAFANLHNLGVVPVYSDYEDDTYLEDSDRVTFNY